MALTVWTKIMMLTLAALTVQHPTDRNNIQNEWNSRNLSALRLNKTSDPHSKVQIEGRSPSEFQLKSDFQLKYSAFGIPNTDGRRRQLPDSSYSHVHTRSLKGVREEAETKGEDIISTNEEIVSLLLQESDLVNAQPLNTSIQKRDRPISDPDINSNVSSSLNETCGFEVTPRANVDDRVIDIAVIVPCNKSHQYSLGKVKPVVELAVKHLKKKGLKGPLANYSINVRYRNSKTSSTDGPLAAVDLYFNRSADVFLGPVEDYVVAPVARFAGRWNVPLLSPGGHNTAFDLRKDYPLLTRLKGFHSEIGQLFLALLDHFSWQMFGFIYEEKDEGQGHSNCYFIVASIYKAIQKLSNSVEKPPLHYAEINSTTTDIESLLRNLHDKVRIKGHVLVVCASPENVRRIMLAAAARKMAGSGDYAFFNTEIFTGMSANYKPWYNASDTDERNKIAKKAYEAVLTVTARTPSDNSYREFSEQVKLLAKNGTEDPYEGEETVNPYVAGFFEGVMVYAAALNATLKDGGSITDGRDIIKHMWNRTYDAKVVPLWFSENISIDANGDRKADYTLLDMDPVTGLFKSVAYYYGESQKLRFFGNVSWPGGKPPLDPPACPYDGCRFPWKIMVGCLAIMVLVMGIGSVYIYRHFKLEADLASMTWKVNWEDVEIIHEIRKEKFGSKMSIGKISAITNASVDSLVDSRQIFIRTGRYKGVTVAIKRLQKGHIDLDRAMLIQLKRLKDLQYDHLVRFIGICIEGDPYSAVLTEYCPKGSLQDILENEEMRLDSMFKRSLMHDVVKGMTFLHNSEIRSHGNLKSSNCVVDSRFVLKICDFGLHDLYDRDNYQQETHAYWKSKLWTAPEILRDPDAPPEGTPQADVYSFAIIVHEIIYRLGAFYVKTISSSTYPPEEIIENVKNGVIPFRPTTDDEPVGEEEVIQMMKKCWAEEPLDRPDFHQLKSIIRKLNKDNESGNILDNLLSRMEQYANNLEALVEERTADYLEEKKRCEELLYQLLPESVANQLIGGGSVVAETYDCVTIYFSDIVGFTALSAQSTPLEVVDLLNDLYSQFDDIIGNFDVYKVETIGDAYMVVSGLPGRNGTDHAREIANMSISLLRKVEDFTIRHRPDDKLKLRIGIHTGPCVAGVVGLKMPRYCLFGDTVNTASRMESYGLPLKIHVSPTTHDMLTKHYPSFKFECRGEIDMKGKGTLTTYWLLVDNEEEA